MAKNLVRNIEILTNEAAVAWKALNGVLVAYKPAALSVYTFQENIKRKLCEDLNQLKQPPLSKYVSIIGPTNQDMTVKVHDDYSLHPLVMGPPYQTSDIVFQSVNTLHRDTSGVLIMGVNKGTVWVNRIKQSTPTRLYRIKGLLGQGTSNCFTTGKVVVRSSYKHVKRYVIDKICASMQSSHQKKMYELMGVDMQSEAAYQLAIKGPIKPTDKKMPMLYSIKCVEFNSPEFVLEIVCINEQEEYLKVLIDTLGKELHTNATCTGIKCVQFGIFHLSHALVINQMELESVLHHMRQCDRLITRNRRLLSNRNPILQDERNSLKC